MEEVATSGKLKKPKAILQGLLQWVPQQTENVLAVYSERGAFWEKWALVEQAILAAAQHKDSSASEVTHEGYLGNDNHVGQKADIHIRNAAGTILIKVSCEGFRNSLDYSVSDDIEKIIEYETEGLSSAWVTVVSVSKEAKDRLNRFNDIWRAKHGTILMAKVENEIAIEMEKALSNDQPSNVREDYTSGQLNRRLTNKIWNEMKAGPIYAGQISIPSKDQEHMTLWFWYKHKGSQT